MTIKHANIIYMPTISELGGIETYVCEMVKKYHNLDIAVVCKQIHIVQRKKIEKYCKIYIHNNEQIECKVAIINYDQSIIPYINKEAKIYQVFHADYTMPIYKDKPKLNPRITSYIAITKYLQDKMKDLLHTDNIMLCRNPLTIDDNKPIIIVSATRLHKNKGVDRMKKLVAELEKQNINYLWFILTGDIVNFNTNRVITLRPRDDVSNFLSIATYVCLLSDTEADSYTIKEALHRNIPILVTPLPYLDEIGVKDNENAYIIDFNCTNIKEVVGKIKNVPTFKYTQMKDSYNKILAKDKSKYISDIELYTYVKVKDSMGFYYDMQLGRNVTVKEGKYKVDKYRAKQLVDAGVCEYAEDENEK